MQIPQSPTLQFPRKLQVHKLSKISVVSGLLTTCLLFAYLPLTDVAYRIAIENPRLIQAVSTMNRKERHLVGLPVRFSISANFSVFDTEN
jgi:hypothetical protein